MNQDRDPFAFVRKVMLPMKHVAARERLQTGMEGLNSVAPMPAIVCGWGATWLALRCERVGGLCRCRFTAAWHDYMPRLCGLVSLNYRLQEAMKEHNSEWLKNMYRCQKLVELLMGRTRSLTRSTGPCLLLFRLPVGQARLGGGSDGQCSLKLYRC